jgi:hypothetical protein
VLKQPATITASAPINRIDIAFIICFLVHKEAGVDRVKRYPKANRNQDPASCQESSPRIKLIGANHGCKVTVEAGIETHEHTGDFQRAVSSLFQHCITSLV